MHDLAGRGWTLAGVTSDTALAAYLVRPGQRSFALDDLSLRYLRASCARITLSSNSFRCSTTTTASTTEAVQTVILRARAVADLADALDEELAPHRLVGAAGRDGAAGAAGAGRAWSAPASPSTSTMLAELQSEFADEIRDAAEAAYAVIGKQINLGSPKQLQVVLFDELEMPKTKRPRPATPPTPTRCSRCSTRPGTRSCSTCSRTATSTRLKVTVDGLLNVGRRRRPHPHHVQPDHRRHRPALVDRAEPAEHPDPHRRRPPDPRRRSWSATATPS